jgi:hypothetical protein
MVSRGDCRIIELWLQNQPSAHTRGCYNRESKSLLKHAKKPLTRIRLADLQRFAQHLGNLGLAPISRVRTLAAVKSLFAFCHRQRYLPVNPASELVLPSYENRLAERILAEEDIHRILAAGSEPRKPHPASPALCVRLAGLGSLPDGLAQPAAERRCRPDYYLRQERTDPGHRVARHFLGELTAQRGAAKADDLVFRSRSGRVLDRGRVRLIVRRAAQRAGIAELSARTGFATPTRPTPSTAGLLYISFKPRSATVLWPRPAVTSTLGRANPARGSSPSKHFSLLACQPLRLRALHAHRLPSLPDRCYPRVKHVEIRLEFIGRGHVLFGCRRLIVAGKPLGPFGHGHIDGLAVLDRDIRELLDLLRLNTGSVALDDPTEQHFFQSAFRRFAH